MSANANNNGIASFGAQKDREPGALTSTFDIFTDELVEGGVLGVRPVVAHSTTPVTTSSGPFSLHCPGIPNLAMDMSSLRLHVKVQAERMDKGGDGSGSVIPTVIPKIGTKPTGLINGVCGSMFRLVEIYLNNKLVSQLSSAAYEKVNYIEKLANFSDSAQETHLCCSNWQLAKLDELYDDEYDDEGNLILKKEHIQGTFEERLNEIVKPTWLSDTIYSEISFIDSVLAPEINVEIRFYRQQSDDMLFFSMDGDYNYRIKLLDMFVTVNQFEMEPAILSEWDRRLSEGQYANYLISRMTLKSYQCMQGVQYFRSNNCFRGVLPNQIIIAFQPTEAFSGSIKRDCQRYYHHFVETITVYINNQTIVTPLEPISWATGDTRQAYRGFMDNMGINLATVAPTGLSYKRYQKGTTLWSFDLTRSMSSGTALEKPRQGILDFAVKFSQATPVGGLTAVVWAYHMDNIYVDGDREVYLSSEMKD